MLNLGGAPRAAADANHPANGLDRFKEGFRRGARRVRERDLAARRFGRAGARGRGRERVMSERMRGSDRGAALASEAGAGRGRRRVARPRRPATAARARLAPARDRRLDRARATTRPAARASRAATRFVPHRRYARRGLAPRLSRDDRLPRPDALHRGAPPRPGRALAARARDGGVGGGAAAPDRRRARRHGRGRGEPRGLQHGTGAFGWIAAQSESGDERFSLACAARAAKWLVEAQDEDGAWRRGASKFVAPGGHVSTNARAAWRWRSTARATRDAARGRRGAPGRPRSRLAAARERLVCRELPRRPGASAAAHDRLRRAGRARRSGSCSTSRASSSRRGRSRAASRRRSR